MDRKSYPDEAFGLVVNNFKFLLHHFPDKVQDENDHDSVNPEMLHFCLSMIDSVPFEVFCDNPEEEREKVRLHLLSHKEALEKAKCDMFMEQFRDPLEPEKEVHVFKARITGVQEVPPVTTEAHGKAVLVYDRKTKELGYTVQFTDHLLSSPETVAHIHVGRAGVLGSTIIPLPRGNPKQGTVSLNDEQEEWLFQGLLYVNIHSREHPVGEIRGQIFPRQARAQKSEKKKKKKSTDGPVYSENEDEKENEVEKEDASFDLHPDIIVESPEGEETVEKIQKEQTPTGAPKPPKVDSNLDDPNNRVLKMELMLLKNPLKQLKVDEKDQMRRKPVVIFPEFDMIRDKSIIFPITRGSAGKEIDTEEEYLEEVRKVLTSALRKYPAFCFSCDDEPKIFGLKARIIKEETISSRTLMSIQMGDDEEFPMSVLVEVRRDGDGDVRSISILNESLPADIFDDFAKFIKSLRKK